MNNSELTARERIKKIQKELGFRAADMAKLLKYLGNYSEQSYNKAVRGKGTFPKKRMDILLSVRNDLNPTYVYWGQGEMFLKDENAMLEEEATIYEKNNLYVGEICPL